MNIAFRFIPTILLGVLYAGASLAQSTVSEDFTGTSTANSWYYSGGACLTASTGLGSGTEFTNSAAGTPGVIPGCKAIDAKVDAYNGETLVGGSNTSGLLPDATGSGALRFTNGCINASVTNCTAATGGGGHSQSGAIISGTPFSSTAGVQVTFKTVTYRGDSQGGGSDGADGISFFLQDASYSPGIGSNGGSLAYSCSNEHSTSLSDGMQGAYLGLGIDEFGNFLNGNVNTLGETGSQQNVYGQSYGDNSATGGFYQPNRIGMRGAGNVNWTWLNQNYPSYYPSSLTVANRYDSVWQTCITGTLWNFSNPSSPTNLNVTSTSSGTGSTNAVLKDYPAIPNAYKVLSGITIANEYASGGLLRTNATPILYRLKITTAGLLSLSYSYNGGAYQSVLANQSISASNGALPSTLRFGFAASTGGSSNIHEVLCFKAAAANSSGSSATANQTQSSKVNSSTQAYFAYYDPNNWTGRLTANPVISDASGNISIATTSSWDASCVLTGVASGSTCASTLVAGPTAAESPTSRVILSWNGSQGVPFEYSSTAGTTTLTATQETTLNQGDSSQTALRLDYLRGQRTSEVTTISGTTTGIFRDRDSVLGDIIDSSPSAVGQPVSPYAIVWVDKTATSTTMPENSASAQSYAQFTTANQTRQNMVYVGANDGMLHGFRAGAFNSSNQFVGTTNDGSELLAFVPGSLIQSAANSSVSTNCTSIAATQTVVQNIHGESPAISPSAACTQATLDYANPQYGHNFFVDGSPATGDLFFNNLWHTWLVGGLGAGGAAIYALDVSTPANFSESNASSLVVGEWTSANISCASNTPANCGNNLGNTYGTPLIRRMHNGTWAVIFGNGFGSSTGDAGVYIMTIGASGTKTFYYLSTGKSGTADGIAYVTSADLDGDHLVDYLYAGDLLGNVWRFDVTNSDPALWATSTGPLFAAGATHPITSALLLAVVTGNAPGTQVLVSFGTGQKTVLTNVAGASYASAAQYLFAFWDWNLTAWNALSPSAQYAVLSTSATGLASPYTLTSANLTAQTLTVSSSGTVDLAASAICWKGTTACTGGATSNSSFGWSDQLPSSGEQVIFNPQLVGSAFNVNSVIPAANSLLLCTTPSDTGYSYLISLATGGLPLTTSGTTGAFRNFTTYNSTGNITTTYSDANAAGVQTNLTGTSTLFLATAAVGGSSAVSASGTANSTSCTLTGTCTATSANTSLTLYPSPLASSAAVCAAASASLCGTTTTSNKACAAISLQCPLSGSRTTRTILR